MLRRALFSALLATAAVSGPRRTRRRRQPPPPQARRAGRRRRAADPAELVARTRPYLESRGASFQGWDPKHRAVLIGTRFGNVSQLHQVAMPMGARTQISFEAEPVGGSYAPKAGDVLVVGKDSGGDEYLPALHARPTAG